MANASTLIQWVDHPELGRALRLPGFVTAHSHAFQRGMRGLAQRASSRAGTFWSWREAMYSLAASLTPERVYELSRVAYAELARAGVVAVGEFHYVHHTPDGTPYADRTVMSDAVIRAAHDEGLLISLLRVVYQRAGQGREPEGVQRRFSDATLDLALQDIDSLRTRWKDDPRVRIGVAPHSVRAVSGEWLGEIAAYARAQNLVVHMHVDEQEAEIEACLSEHKCRPVEIIESLGLLETRFCAVHATCANENEVRLMGRAKAMACICSTTERDLGDGLGPIESLRAHGVSLCVGVDSHVVSEHLEEVRALETHERLRLRRRLTWTSDTVSLAEQLLTEGSVEGARAIGFLTRTADQSAWTASTWVPKQDQQCMKEVDEEHWPEALVFSATRATFAREATLDSISMSK